MKIIVDTQEKIPWLFKQTASAENVIHRKLPTGDYTIDGMEDLLCIERKKSVAELATNVTSDRFHRQLVRMEEFKHKFLILEFDYRHIDDFPEGSDIPKSLRKKIRVRGPFIIKCLSNIMLQHHICVLPCSNATYAEHVAYSLMKEIYARYK